MKQISLGNSDLSVPEIAVGCMRMSQLKKKQAEYFIKAAMDLGANYFEHADIYGGQGRCEEVFAEAIHMNDDIREKIFIQTKCGIIPGKRYDFSKEHILYSVNESLRRLKTDYIDTLVLHRPDALVEPEEVADTFDILKSSGKVRHFGVSNHNPMQIRLLKKYLRQPLLVNQLQFGIMHAAMVTLGTHVNMTDDAGVNRDGEVLDYCRLEEITIQPWSPFQYGFFEGVFVNNSRFPQLNETLERIAASFGGSSTTIALAWILRHPARMQPVIGTTNPERLKECIRATEITLSREQWYDIYLAAGHTLP